MPQIRISGLEATASIISSAGQGWCDAFSLAGCLKARPQKAAEGLQLVFHFGTLPIVVKLAHPLSNRVAIRVRFSV